MKTAAAYIRVSTEDQIEFSPASQLEKIRDYAKRNDYILPDEFVFMDEGISGRNTVKRPEFNRMIGVAKQKPKPFDAILLWKFSRFARNREDSIVYKSMLRKQCGIDVISISENIGDDKMSVLIEAMIEAMDEYYSINLAEEVRRGMAEKASRGQAVSIPSYGYLIRDGKYYPDPDTAPIVRQMFDDYLSGVGLVTIARRLNDAGHRTRRGNLFENRTVRYILSNPVYIGYIRFTADGKTDYRALNTGTMIKAEHEPIIDRTIFDAVQKKLLQSARTPYRREKSAAQPFMLQGLCRCSACGATLVQSASKTSLQCYSYARGTCKLSHSISLKKINDMVISSLATIVKDESAKINLSPKPIKQHDNDIPAQIAKEEKKLKRIREGYESEVYTLDEFKQARSAILEKIKQLRSEQCIVITNPEIERSRIRGRIALMLPSICSPALPEEDKNSLLKSVIDRIIFYRPTGSIDIFFYSS